LIRELRDVSSIPAFRLWLDWLMAWVEERHDDMRALTKWMKDPQEVQDPESYFMEAWMACGAGLYDLGLPQLQRAIEGGYSPASTLATGKPFEALRGDPAFVALQRTAEASRLEALAAFRAAGGERLLGK
jgi:hypothetical protein